jgi:hypothetical protein
MFRLRQLTHFPFDLRASGQLREHVQDQMYRADMKENGRKETPRLVWRIGRGHPVTAYLSQGTGRGRWAARVSS